VRREHEQQATVNFLYRDGRMPLWGTFHNMWWRFDGAILAMGKVVHNLHETHFHKTHGLSR
jgi:hypothetical protein